MEYNTTREKLLLPEYGRGIQNMIEYLCTVEDRELRNKLAKAIISIMSQLAPQQRDPIAFKQKLWDHLFFISDFQLDVDSPFPKPEKQELFSKPNKIQYSQQSIKFRSYGKNIENIIFKVIEYEDGPEKEELIKTIANHLKKAYLNWNRDSVEDEVIVNHFDILSKGKLKLQEDFQFNQTVDILKQNKPKKKFIPKQNNNHRNRKKI